MADTPVAETQCPGRDRSTAWLLPAVVLLVFGTNLQGIVLPLRGHERGAGMLAVGLYSAAWSAGFLGSVAAFGAMLSRFGHVRSFAALCACAGCCALLFPLSSRDGTWIAIRLVCGFCYGGAAAIVEAWMLERAQAGPAFARYMIANLFASLCGTLSLDLVRPDGWAPFLLAAGSLGLATVPVLGGRPAAPPPPAPFRPRPVALARRTALGTAGCLLAGLLTGALGGLGPVFGAACGLGMRDDTLMLAANSVGGALGYVPAARLAERWKHRTVIAALAGFGLLVSVPVALWGGRIGAGGLAALLFLFGAAQYPLYGLAIGLCCDRSPDRPVPAVSGDGLLLFGAGTVAGPLLGGQAMRLAGPAALFGMLGAFLAVLLLMVAGSVLRDRDRRSGRRVPLPPPPSARGVECRGAAG